eukprot:SAG11_NODE_4242_length_1991_cov_3.034884_3_plen_71_part_00
MLVALASPAASWAQPGQSDPELPTPSAPTVRINDSATGELLSGAANPGQYWQAHLPPLPLVHHRVLRLRW